MNTHFAYLSRLLAEMLNDLAETLADVVELGIWVADSFLYDLWTGEGGAFVQWMRRPKKPPGTDLF